MDNMNRADKSVLSIRTMYPEYILCTAFPHLTKHLQLDLHFVYNEQYLNNNCKFALPKIY